MAEMDGSRSTGLALLKAHPSASLGSGLTPSTALKAGRLKRNRLSLTGQPRKSRGPAGRDVSSSSHGLLGETRADTGQRTLAGAFAIDASGESLAGPPSVTDAAMPSAGQPLSTERCTQGDCSTPSLDGMQQALSAAWQHSPTSSSAAGSSTAGGTAPSIARLVHEATPSHFNRTPLTATVSWYPHQCHMPAALAGPGTFMRP